MDFNSTNKTILIAPLNWGLGHATRCIPIIKALQENNYIPIIASDGAALELLRKEFPYLQTQLYWGRHLLSVSMKTNLSEPRQSCQKRIMHLGDY